MATKKVKITPTKKTKVIKTKVALAANHVKAKHKNYMAKRPHRTFRISKWANRQLGGKPLGKMWPLILDSFSVIWQERRILIGLAVLYALINVIVVGAVATQEDFVDLKDSAMQVMGGQVNQIGKVFTLFTAAMSGVLTQEPTQLQQFLAPLVAFMFWLAFIWALRMRFAGEKITIRDALYNSNAPFISSLLVGMAIVVQLLPGALGIFVIVTAQSVGAIQPGVEFALFSAGAALLCVLSLYWVVSSALALVVVTLPSMYPWHALASASELVVGQRWRLVLRVLVLVVVLAIVWAGVLIPVLLLDNWLNVNWLPLLPAAMTALGAFSLTYGSVYVYKLYRSLL